jgi:hypothetical protein
MMKKQLGNNNKKAREAAVAVLTGFKGKKVTSLKDNELRELVTAILQLLALADESGNIK